VLPAHCDGGKRPELSSLGNKIIVYYDLLCFMIEKPFSADI
jgi:hypothetical protein